MPDREKVIKGLEHCRKTSCESCPYNATDVKNSNPICLINEMLSDAIALLKEQEAVVHPEPSCEMTYITNCSCDLCGVQLIREDNFCRCCGKRIEWEGR